MPMSVPRHPRVSTDVLCSLREFACLTAVILTPLRVEVALDGPSVTSNNSQRLAGLKSMDSYGGTAQKMNPPQKIALFEKWRPLGPLGPPWGPLGLLGSPLGPQGLVAPRQKVPWGTI